MKQVSRRDFAALVGVGLLVSACGTLKPSSEQTATSGGAGGGGGQDGTTAKPVVDDVAIDAPPKLTDPLLSSDVLVYSQNTLDKATIDQDQGDQGQSTARRADLDGLSSSSTSRK